MKLPNPSKNFMERLWIAFSLGFPAIVFLILLSSCSFKGKVSLNVEDESLPQILEAKMCEAKTFEVVNYYNNVITNYYVVANDGTFMEVGPSRYALTKTGDELFGVWKDAIWLPRTNSVHRSVTINK